MNLYLIYTAGNADAPFCHLRPVQL